MHKIFPLKNVIELYNTLQQNNIPIWIDGGWGVDALLKKQTREHEDLDIVVEERNLRKLISLLKVQGYFENITNDSSTWNFVVKNKYNLEIDIHVINFDKFQNGIYGPKENGVFYPAQAFTGIGLLNNIMINCISVEYQLESHTGYILREKDYKDVIALCEKFNLNKPIEYP